MPVVAVFRNQFLRLIGKTLSEEEFDELCFQVGLELDDVTSEVREKPRARVFSRLSCPGVRGRQGQGRDQGVSAGQGAPREDPVED